MTLRDRILTLWKEGYDTKAISQALWVKEAYAYNVIARQKVPKVKPEPPKSVVRPEPPRNQYRLRVHGLYLSKDKDSMTHVLADAWMGNADEALALCGENALVKDALMETV